MVKSFESYELKKLSEIRIVFICIKKKCFFVRITYNYFKKQCISSIIFCFNPIFYTFDL